MHRRRSFWPSLTAALICCASCSSAAPQNPFQIAGAVELGFYPDGGSFVSVDTAVSRALDDGGLEDAPDAGVTLNGVALSGGIWGGAGMPVFWQATGTAGAVPGGHQLLTVVGANPPATVDFDCPGTVLFTAPAENASFAPGSTATLQWTTPAPALQISYGWSAATTDGSAHADMLDETAAPGVTTTTLSAAEVGLDGGVDVHFFLEAPGDVASDGASFCYVVPHVDFSFQ